MAKKTRLKIKRPSQSKKKKQLGIWDYIIFGLGAIAAVTVAIWGGYYLGKQSDELKLEPGLQTIISRSETFRKNGDLQQAEKIVTIALKKYEKKEALYLELSQIYVDQDNLTEADKVIHAALTESLKRRTALEYLRQAYRQKNMIDEAVRISKELAELE